VRLDDAVEVDYDRLSAQARQLIAEDGPDVVGALEPDRVEADLLPGWDEQWLMIERERYRQLMRDVEGGRMLRCTTYVDSLDDFVVLGEYLVGLRERTDDRAQGDGSTRSSGSRRAPRRTPVKVAHAWPVGWDRRITSNLARSLTRRPQYYFAVSAEFSTAPAAIRVWLSG
jgi:hypothetical protein